jgi:hypothetical protein
MIKPFIKIGGKLRGFLIAARIDNTINNKNGKAKKNLYKPSIKFVKNLCYLKNYSLRMS